MSSFVGLQIMTFVPNFSTQNPTLIFMVAEKLFYDFYFFCYIYVMQKSEKIRYGTHNSNTIALAYVKFHDISLSVFSLFFYRQTSDAQCV